MTKTAAQCRDNKANETEKPMVCIVDMARELMLMGKTLDTGNSLADILAKRAGRRL